VFCNYSQYNEGHVKEIKMRRQNNSFRGSERRDEEVTFKKSCIKRAPEKQEEMKDQKSRKGLDV